MVLVPIKNICMISGANVFCTGVAGAAGAGVAGVAGAGVAGVAGAGVAGAGVAGFVTVTSDIIDLYKGAEKILHSFRTHVLHTQAKNTRKNFFYLFSFLRV